MKKLFTIFVVGFLSFSIAHSKDTLTIVHFNDTHSCLTPGGQRDDNLNATWGGVARMATFIGMNKQANPNTIVLHSGDMFIGDLFFNVFFGVAELAILNAIGLDAMTVGNHEWDLTPYMLMNALDTAKISFPLLSANMVILDSNYNGLTKHIKPYTTKQVGPIKVGIFGLTTPEANLISQPLPAVFIDTLLAEKTIEMVSTLRSVENCDVVILLSHLGLDLDKLIAANIPGIDIIIGGHDHFELNQPVIVENPMQKDVMIVQAGAQYKFAGKLDLIINNGEVEGIQYYLAKLDKTIPEEPNTAGMVNVLVSRIEAIYGPVFTQRIGYCKADLTETVTKDSPTLFTDVGKLVTEAFKDFTKTEIAIEPSGSTAQPLYKGPIVADDVYRMLSYGFNTDNGLGFRLCTLKLSGLDIFKGLEIGLARLDVIDDYLIQATGLDYTYDMSQPPYGRVTGVIINGEPIDITRKYTITSNEILLQLLPLMEMTVEDPYIYEGLSEFEVVVNYIKSKDTISTGVDDRMQNSQPAVKVFPNPVTKLDVTICSEISSPGMYSIRIYDKTGKEVQRIEPQWFDAGPFVRNIQLSELSTGNYYFEMTNWINSIKGSFILYR